MSTLIQPDDIAAPIAAELTEQRMDPNEVAKAATYLTAHPDGPLSSVGPYA